MNVLGSLRCFVLMWCLQTVFSLSVTMMTLVRAALLAFASVLRLNARCVVAGTVDRDACVLAMRGGAQGRLC